MNDTSKLSAKLQILDTEFQKRDSSYCTNLTTLIDRGCSITDNSNILDCIITRKDKNGDMKHIPAHFVAKRMVKDFNPGYKTVLVTAKFLDDMFKFYMEHFCKSTLDLSKNEAMYLVMMYGDKFFMFDIGDMIFRRGMNAEQGRRKYTKSINVKNPATGGWDKETLYNIPIIWAEEHMYVGTSKDDRESIYDKCKKITCDAITDSILDSQVITKASQPGISPFI